MASQTDTQGLMDHLKSVLLELNAHPYPEVACPPKVPKRASVALVLRLQPSYNHWPAYADKPLDYTSQQPPRPRRRSSAASGSGQKLSFEDILHAFFELDWVKHGDPEILFIKRAT